MYTCLTRDGTFRPTLTNMDLYPTGKECHPPSFCHLKRQTQIPFKIKNSLVNPQPLGASFIHGIHFSPPSLQTAPKKQYTAVHFLLLL